MNLPEGMAGLRERNVREVRGRNYKWNKRITEGNEWGEVFETVITKSMK